MSQESTPAPATPVPDENKLIAERREKLRGLRAQQAGDGGTAFPNDFKPGDRAAALHAAHGAVEKPVLDADIAAGKTIGTSVAGRMMLKRVMGKASFATLQDATGRIQIYIAHDEVGKADYEAFKHWDLGDIIAAEGHLFKTKTGELSIHARRIRLLTKSLRPLPDKFHGMQDQELKYRQRYVDLIMDEAARALCRAQPHAGGHARLHDRPWLHGGGNPHAAPHSGRRQRQALRHAPQRAGPADVPAHRARAVPEAPDRRRLRARVRDQPQLPQRGDQRPPQPRVHDDGVLRRVLELPGPDGLH